MSSNKRSSGRAQTNPVTSEEKKESINEADSQAGPKKIKVSSHQTANVDTVHGAPASTSTSYSPASSSTTRSSNSTNAPGSSTSAVSSSNEPSESSSRSAASSASDGPSDSKNAAPSSPAPSAATGSPAPLPAPPASSSSSEAKAPQFAEIPVPPELLQVRPLHEYTFQQLLIQAYGLRDTRVRLTESKDIDLAVPPASDREAQAQHAALRRRMAAADQVDLALTRVRALIGDMVGAKRDAWFSAKFRNPSSSGSFVHKKPAVARYYGANQDECMLTGVWSPEVVCLGLSEPVPTGEYLPDLLGLEAAAYHHPCFAINVHESVLAAYRQRKITFRARRTVGGGVECVMAITANTNTAELLAGRSIASLIGQPLSHVDPGHAPHGGLLNWHYLFALEIGVLSPEAVDVMGDAAAFETSIEPGARP